MLYLSALKAGETLDNRMYATLGYHPEGTPPRFLSSSFALTIITMSILNQIQNKHANYVVP
jgi:hypothetical protein